MELKEEVKRITQPNYVCRKMRSRLLSVLYSFCSKSIVHFPSRHGAAPRGDGVLYKRNNNH
eukprot:3724557-Amphidinium_carterae.1